MSKYVLKIFKDDAVIVIRPDGNYECSLPKEGVLQQTDHLITAATLIYALNHPEIMSIIEQHMFSHEKRKKKNHLRLVQNNTPHLH